MTLDQFAKGISIALFRQAGKLAVRQLGNVIDFNLHILPPF